MENTKQQIEKASEYYAHNYFDMHETNSYKELKRGFEAGVEWAIKNIKVERLFCECPNNFDIYQETKTYHTSCNKEVKIIRTK
tara:strand:+ start:232 stop:480 length:249 start_codon:yes stop_codon:yes gene_type:complete